MSRKHWWTKGLENIVKGRSKIKTEIRNPKKIKAKRLSVRGEWQSRD